MTFFSLMFWTDFAESVVMSAGLDGKNKTIVTSSFTISNGIALDTKGRLG